jgi:hypothetical protein
MGSRRWGSDQASAASSRRLPRGTRSDCLAATQYLQPDSPHFLCRASRLPIPPPCLVALLGRMDKELILGADGPVDAITLVHLVPPFVAASAPPTRRYLGDRSRTGVGPRPGTIGYPRRPGGSHHGRGRASRVRHPTVTLEFSSTLNTRRPCTVEMGLGTIAVLRRLKVRGSRCRGVRSRPWLHSSATAHNSAHRGSTTTRL